MHSWTPWVKGPGRQLKGQASGPMMGRASDGPQPDAGEAGLRSRQPTRQLEQLFLWWHPPPGLPCF